MENTFFSRKHFIVFYTFGFRTLNESTTKNEIRHVKLTFRDFFYLTSERRKVVSEYIETNISHLAVNNIGENIQNHVFHDSKNTSSALYENDVRKEIRRTVTS